MRENWFFFFFFTLFFESQALKALFWGFMVTWGHSQALKALFWGFWATDLRPLSSPKGTFLRLLGYWLEATLKPARPKGLEAFYFFGRSCDFLLNWIFHYIYHFIGLFLFVTWWVIFYCFYYDKNFYFSEISIYFLFILVLFFIDTYSPIQFIYGHLIQDRI